MQQIYLTRRDFVLDDGSFLKLGFTDLSASADSPSDVLPLSERMDFSVSRAMEILRGDPDLGARFLCRTGGMDGGGTIYWNGGMSSVQTLNGSVGVRIVPRREGDEVVGDNRFGRFLGTVRYAYRAYLRNNVITENPVDESKIVTDYTRKGAFESELEVREREGASFIHTDVYQRARFRFDTALDGTTGHASRASAGDAPFQKFDCPFGTSYPAPLVVGSAAEASMLYERAIRGELDWKALLRTLSEQGTLSRSLSERQKEVMAQDYAAQFAWMRERISVDSTLRNSLIVAPSRLVPDESFGRSVYDAEHAPSPAHVLARYIENPLLLYAPSQNGVVRALAERDRKERQRFSVPEGTSSVTLLVIGSDTIGGREPGGKASSKMVRETRKDAGGRKYTTQVKKYDIPFKTQEEVEADYAAFSVRMDSVLGSFPEGTQVRLVTGSSSTMGDGVGVGTPKLVERYVKEKGGSVSPWDFSRHAAGRVSKAVDADAPDPGLSAVMMDHFADCLPVLVGRSPSVSFLLDARDEGSDVSFRQSDGLSGDGAVCFSVKEDTSNRNILAMGSYAADAGLPVVHVMQNWTEESQAGMLASGALLSHAAFTGGLDVEESLFLSGDREIWNLGGADVLSYVDSLTGIASPEVNIPVATGISVAGYTYRTLYGAYGALLAQETGRADSGTLLALHNAEGSFSALSAAVAAVSPGPVPDDVMERCLRRSVRLMAASDGAFAERLASLGDRDVVIPVNEGDMRLFTDLDGHGSNRFGVVLAAEGRRLREQREARRINEERERTRMLQEAARRQQVIDQKTADGQKVLGGFPASAEAASDAVWFLGTNSPIQLHLPDEERSFVMWDDMGGEDRLTRAKAVSPRLDDGMGGKVDNTYVFLFPTDLASVTGRRRVSPRSDSTNLSDCMRVDPRTGEKFTCAYGIPVRFNNLGNEAGNKDMLPCSYRLDNDAANYARSIVLADSQARVQALRHGMELCLPGRERPGGEDYYTLGQVFMDKTYTKKDGWSDNPHRSPLNLDITQRYISLLERGSRFPLNMVTLPLAEYGRERDAAAGGKYALSAEGRFLADLNMSLRIANATALALGVPLRFPLGPDGRIDLGPGVPEEYRALAERKIDAFINVVREEDLSKGRLPLLSVMTLRESVNLRRSGAMQKAGDVYLRPNDLVAAFGQFDFGTLLAGGIAPLHEMSFRLGEDVFLVQDSRTNRGMDLSDINKYLSYEKNDNRRFVVRTNNPARLDEFTAVLTEYTVRAQAVNVEMRLVQEGERDVEDQSLRGFVNLLDSNSDAFVSDEHDIGREATVHNAEGRVNAQGEKEERSVTGDKVSGIYYGREDAKDGFAGYAQIRYSYDGAPMSSWRTVEDLELAKDIVMTLVGRKYSSMDEREVPSAKTMDLMLKAEAMKDLVARGIVLDKGPSGRKAAAADDKVVEIPRGAAPEGEAAGATASRKEDEVASITEFKDENRFLSNFWPAQVTYEGVVYPTVENAFQAAKCADPALRKPFETLSPADARKYGRTVQLRDGWDSMKETVMTALVRQKFTSDEALRSKLIATGGASFSEGNRWGDTYWGVDLESGRGENRLGRILMELRGELSGQKRSGGRVFVTYYGSRSVPEDAYRVQISTSSPEGMTMDACVKALYPDYGTMVGPHKEGRIDDAEYSRRYAETVLGPKRKEILSSISSLSARAAEEGRDLYLFCYCKPGEFCHRYLVSNFLNENGIRCEEVPADRRLYTKGHVPEAEYTATPVHVYDGDITPGPNTVFVFGSNPEGRHGAGAAKVARERFGAVNGRGEGLQGNAYAIPTKDLRVKEDGGLRSIPPERITESIAKMYGVARENPGMEFMVAYRNTDTASLNGYTGYEMMRMFADAGPVPENVAFSREWVDAGFPDSFNRQEQEAQITFTRSAGGYQDRTRENANADDVDFTFAFAVDFSTYGERATAKAAGSSLVASDIPLRPAGGIDLSRKAVDAVVRHVADSLPDEYLHGESCGVNIAGNGIYTLAGKGVTQDQCDEFVVKVLDGLRKKGLRFTSVRSGGQTGVDESGAVAGAVLGIPATVHTTKDWAFRTADGKDVRDEKAFRERFTAKDVSSLRTRAGLSPAPAKEKNIRKGMNSIII